MPLPRTSKEKSARIDWGYVRRPSRLARVRTLLWLLAAVAVVVPLAGLTLASGLSGSPPQQFASLASRGRVANPHAMWDSQCEACHEPFQQIGGDRWLGRFTSNTLGVSLGNAGKASDTKCEGCHSGPAHHPTQKPEAVVGCADCHRDHQGRGHDLNALADSGCVRCHGDLPAYSVKPEAVQVATTVTSFAGDHPNFRQHDPKAKKHERTLKFSHAVHVTPGLGVGSSGYTFADIPDPKERQRYMALAGVTDPKAPVSMDCFACHQLDTARSDGAASSLTGYEEFTKQGRPLLTGVPKEPLQPPRPAGAYFLPVNFESHCKGCHPLTFDETVRGPDGRERQAPHRLQPAQIDEFLHEVYAARYVAEKLKAPIPPARGTGRLDPLPDDLDPAALKLARGRIAEQVSAAKQTLFVGNKTCQECHYLTLPGSDAVAKGADPRFPVAVVPGNVPTVWQPRAKFNHASHRAMTCQSCHPNTYLSAAQEKAKAREYAAVDAAQPDYQHPPALPAIDNCRQCHGPARTENGVAVAGVRAGCVDCHLYHHADRRLQALGSPLRDPLNGGTDLADLIRAKVSAAVPGK